MKDIDGKTINVGDYVTSVFVTLIGKVTGVAGEEGSVLVHWENGRTTGYRGKCVRKLEPEELI
jgi:hypothetical protein